MTRRPQGRLQKSSSSLSVVNNDAAGSNKFAFWRSRPTTNAEKFIVVEDEFTGLDIQTALFPSGMMDDASPENFRQLQANAEHTISRLLIAYKENLQSAREVTSEKNVLNDELEAAQTRSEHLKLQVANMAADAAKQESVMQSMAEELVALRCKIREDAEFRNKGVRLVTKECSDAGDIGYSVNSNYRSKRQSADSFTSEESSSDSVFSQPPMGSCTPISTADDGQDLYQGLEYESLRVEAVKECQNCHGVRRSDAWDVVHVLKEESRALKTRIAQCESANADALMMLDMVSAAR
jgi:chromosome segregation ATPase